MALVPLFPLRTSEAIDSIQKTLVSHIKIQLELLDGQ